MKLKNLNKRKRKKLFKTVNPKKKYARLKKNNQKSKD